MALVPDQACVIAVPGYHRLSKSHAVLFAKKKNGFRHSCAGLRKMPAHILQNPMFLEYLQSWMVVFLRACERFAHSFGQIADRYVRSEICGITHTSLLLTGRPYAWRSWLVETRKDAPDWSEVGMALLIGGQYEWCSSLVKSINVALDWWMNGATDSRISYFGLQTQESLALHQNSYFGPDSRISCFGPDSRNSYFRPDLIISSRISCFWPDLRNSSKYIGRNLLISCFGQDFRTSCWPSLTYVGPGSRCLLLTW